MIHLPSTQNTNFKNSDILNDRTFIDYMERFKKIATSIFVWENLPDSCSARWLEETLYYLGKAAFLFDENLGYINTQAVPSGELNIYGLPININCHSFNYNSERPLYQGGKVGGNEEAILIMNNYDCRPTEESMLLFSLRLYEAERTIDVNIKAQKTPTLLLCDEKQRLTLKQLYMKYDGNQPFIFGDKNLFKDGSKIDSISTNAPYVVDKIMEYKKQIWNEALTFLGINSLADEKKERLITDEANSNNELINMNLQSFLLTREEACRQINEKFGLNVSVKVRSDLHNVIKETQSINIDNTPDKEVDINE